MTFEIGVLFSEDELVEYGNSKSEIELKTKYYSDAFLTIPINSSVFVPNIKRYFTIGEFSNDYYLKLNGKSYSHPEVIRKNGKMAVFRSRIRDERAKRVFSNLLYTNTRYIVIIESENTIRELTRFPNIDCIGGEPLF